MPARRAHITRFEPSLISAEAELVPALLGMYIENLRWLYIGDARHVLCQRRPEGICACVCVTVSSVMSHCIIKLHKCVCLLCSCAQVCHSWICHHTCVCITSVRVLFAFVSAVHCASEHHCAFLCHRVSLICIIASASSIACVHQHCMCLPGVFADFVTLQLFGARRCCWSAQIVLS